MKSQEPTANNNAARPISLHPLSFDEAISDLLKVKPPTKDTPKKRKTPKKATKKRKAV